jgi:hypothetical protein
MAGEEAIWFGIFLGPADAVADFCQFVPGGGSGHGGDDQEAFVPKAGTEGGFLVVDPSASYIAASVPLVRDVRFVFVRSGRVLIVFDAGGGGQLLVRWRGVKFGCVDGHGRHDGFCISRLWN